METLYLQYVLGVAFLMIVFLHIAKKNDGAIIAYAVQSLAIVVFLFSSFLKTGNLSLLFIVLLTLIVKVILAPLFFTTLIKKHALPFSVNTYLNTPLTLTGIAIITAIAHSEKFLPLTTIVPDHQAILSLALSSILLSFFLIVNHKGALAQIIGILSLENSIVAFTLFAGLEQSMALQLGIIFNIFIWLIIATVFISLIYKHFSSLDVTLMTHLRD